MLRKKFKEIHGRQFIIFLNCVALYWNNTLKTLTEFKDDSLKETLRDHWRINWRKFCHPLADFTEANAEL